MRIKRKLAILLPLAMLLVMLCPVIAMAAEEEVAAQPALYATFWSLIPAIVAIVLALITKEVYSSLLIGVIVGALFASKTVSEAGVVTGFNFIGTVQGVMQGGIISVVSDSYNVGILVFLVILGTMVALMNKAGGSAAFGEWAGTHIKSRVGAQLMTLLLGCIIFIDDYFNCLTVGSVMRPVSDKHKVSRAKLAYIIDATAAPVCIIAPISSWAAAVAGFVEGEDGFSLFVHAIPFNYYAILTIVMMIVIILLRFDYGPMKKHERNAIEKGDLFTSGQSMTPAEEIKGNDRGRVIDMLFPIICLIACCIIFMIYTGGFFEGANVIEAFSNADASLGLALGSFVALIITVVYMLCRRVLSFTECMKSLPEGFKAMVPAILILVLAWSLKTMTDTLGAATFVATAMANVADQFMGFLPAIIFLVGVGLAFATGTSWGTFGILIPIVVGVFPNNPQLLIIGIAACMAGAVCGDHCSPISDTTIMASAGSQSNHINHVSTQLPYALTVAFVSCVTYIIAGFVKRAAIVLPIGIVIMIVVLLIIRVAARNTGDTPAEE
ncbi:MAG: Na+/H+ antiporter NhaC family protein [Lachnospiraceae bacterium]|nr:Na+/H+ antiporter NhaC family protein [Lachnospiraceae bacterium]